MQFAIIFFAVIKSSGGEEEVHSCQAVGEISTQFAFTATTKYYVQEVYVVQSASSMCSR